MNKQPYVLVILFLIMLTCCKQASQSNPGIEYFNQVTQDIPGPIKMFYNSIVNGSLDDVAVALNENPKWINGTDLPYTTPLHLASAGNQKETINYLIKKGADINAPDYQGNRPLHITRDPETLRLLIDNGAKADVYNQEGYNPIFYAIIEDRPKLVKEYIKVHDFLLKSCVEGRRLDPLVVAIEHQKIEITKLLLTDKNLVFGMNEKSQKHLSSAIKTDNVELVELLLDKGFTLKNDNISSKALFDHAIRNNNDNLVTRFKDVVKRF